MAKTSTKKSGAKASAELLPVYLFVGNDHLKREALVKRMQERVGELGDLTLNQASFSAQDVETPESILAACTTLPFLSEKRLVIVKDIEFANKDLLTVLADYLDNPSTTTVLVMIGDKLSKATKLYKKLSANFPKAIVLCEEKTKKNDIEGFIKSQVASAGVSIDIDAITRLRELVGTSSVAINSEISKLVGYITSNQRSCITMQDVNAMVTRREQPKPWDLTDPLSRRNVKRVLDVLSQMEDRDKPLGLMTMCTKRMRELLVAKSLEMRPGSPSVAEVLGGNPYAYRNHLQFSRNFTEEELIMILNKAADCEEMMKTGYDPTYCFEMWLIGVCTGVWA